MHKNYQKLLCSHRHTELWGETKLIRNLHLLDAVFVDALEILGAVDKYRGDQMAQPFKYIPKTQKMLNNGS